MARKLYRCENDRCPLGDRDNPGQFTGGITAEQALMLTGDPEAPHGDGYCPACGVKGKAAGTIEPRKGSDPNAKHHEAVAARVADPDDPLTGPDAQDALLELVGEKEAGE